MSMDEKSLERAARVLRNAGNVLVFTGAGVSAESGISTFRDDTGFWTRFPPDRFATWGGLVKTATHSPSHLAEFLLCLLEPIALARPNPAHLAIERLEQHTRVTVVTQNVDRLHQEAGSTTVHEVHGSLFGIVDRKGRFVQMLSRPEMLRIVAALRRAGRRPMAALRLMWALRPLYGVGTSGLHRPNIVLFGDAMAEPAWSLSLKAARQCDCLITIGTSGVVLPAAMLPHDARHAGAALIGIGPEEGDADFWLNGPAGLVMPVLVERAFGAKS